MISTRLGRSTNRNREYNYPFLDENKSPPYLELIEPLSQIMRPGTRATTENHAPISMWIIYIYHI